MGCRLTFRFLLTGKIDNHLFYRLESSIRGLSVAVKLGLDVVLDVAGWVAPNAQEQMKTLSDELGVSERVRLKGTYTQEQAPMIYQAADAYIMTKHNDPCPNTVLEALACGLPVLYSDTGGVRELVGDAGIGLECLQSWDMPHVPTADSIGQGMVDIAQNHDVFSRMARSRAVQNFDVRHWEQRHREVFEALINR